MDTQIEVATGRMFLPVPGATCHGQPIPPNQRKVQIDFCVEANRSHKLPTPVADVVEIHEAVGSFVLWPVHLIEIESTGQVYIFFKK